MNNLNYLKGLTLYLSYLNKASHITSNLSCLNILDYIYKNIDKNKILQFASDRDYIIHSKGHASLALFVTLFNHDIINKEDLLSYLDDTTLYGGHVTFIEGKVEFSTGSLGHGLPHGLGISLYRIRNNIAGKVVVVMSDGELNEGTTWESALFANHHNLNNLIVFLDNNGFQALGKTDKILTNSNISEKFSAFGWKVVEANEATLSENNTIFTSNFQKPILVNYKSTKGNDITFMKDGIDWHYKSLTKDQINKCLIELGLDIEDFQKDFIA